MVHLFPSSSGVERLTVNQNVVGSIPTLGAWAIGAAVSVAGLHPVGRGFESLIAHLNNNYQLKINAH